MEQSYNSSSVQLVKQFNYEVENFSMYPSSSSSSGDNNPHYLSTNDLQKIINEWTRWIKSFTAEGWDAYLVSILFNELPGSIKTKKIQMNQANEWMYNRLGTRMVRNTRSEKWKRYLPVGIFVPDFPVPKYRKDCEKSTIEDVSINDGLHMGGIILGNRWGRIRHGLQRHFKHEKTLYRTGKIRSIGVKYIKPTTYDLEKAVDYTFKSLKRRTCTPDDVQVLNWGGAGPSSEATRRWMMRAFPH
jgi:hypothetical protein